jgi:C4-dicarboxylate-specific signal transduction histidine kinase
MAEFSASIAHEICQPLLGIAANAAASLRWLQRDVPDVDEAIAGLKDIRAGCERAANIVKALGALARQAPLQMQILNIDDVIREAIQLTQPALTAQRVRLETALSVNQSIVADAVQLQQLLVNLITNALEAMAGSAQEESVLRINSFNLKEGVEVCVEDNGPGIPAERREQIFGAFYTTKSTGLGVGLAICRAVVDAHHGRIWAQASACGGARMRFKLPTCCY